MNRTSVQLLLMSGCVGFLALVWPTIYSYDHLDLDSSGQRYPLRIHRISGNAEVFVPTVGWEDASKDPATADSSKLENLPTEEIALIEGTAEIGDSKLQCTLYNGSGWRIQELVVEVKILPFKIDMESLPDFGDNDDKPVDTASETTVYAPPRPRLTRDYKLSNTYFTEPLTSGLFNEYVWLDLMPGERLEWRIKSAKGIRQ